MSRVTRAPGAIPFIALLWLGCSLMNATQVYLSMFDHGHSYLRILAYNIVCWAFWAAMALPLFRFAAKWPMIPFTFAALTRHLLLALVLGTAHIAASIALIIAMRPYDEMGITRFGPNFVATLPMALQLELIVYAAVVGVAHTLDYYRRFRERERDAAQLVTELSRARLHALELQLRPHFLFNALHSINGLVRTSRNEEAVSTIVGLSELLRASLDQGEELVPLSKELSIFDKFMAIEQVRFSDRLTVKVDVTDSARDVRVPPFILQPLAENAMQHGISKSAGPGRLDLRAKVEDEKLRIDLFNTGPAPSPGSVEGVGLSNTRARLRHLFGSEASLTMNGETGGTRVVLSIPLAETQS